MTDELKPCPFCGHTPDPENYIDSIHPITRDGHVWEAGCIANEGGCDAFILGDSREDVIKRWNTRAKDVQKAINDEKQNPWKAAIINELIVDCIFAKEHETDPHKALAAAIDWNCKVALDPSVSKEAQDLQQRAIDAALESVADLLDSGDDWNTGDEIAEFIRSRIGTNPLAERAAEYARGIEFRVGQLAEAQARIAELERERDRAIQQHERCAEKLFNAERQRDMLSEAAKAALHYMRLHKYADQAWADDLEAAIAAAMTPNAQVTGLSVSEGPVDRRVRHRANRRTEMTDEQLIAEVARVWVDGGGDADGLDWCHQKLKEAVNSEIENRVMQEQEREQ